MASPALLHSSCFQAGWRVVRIGVPAFGFQCCCRWDLLASCTTTYVVRVTVTLRVAGMLVAPSCEAAALQVLLQAQRHQQAGCVWRAAGVSTAHAGEGAWRTPGACQAAAWQLLTGAHNVSHMGRQQLRGSSSSCLHASCVMRTPWLVHDCIAYRVYAISPYAACLRYIHVLHSAMLCWPHRLRM